MSRFRCGRISVCLTLNVSFFFCICKLFKLSSDLFFVGFKMFCCKNSFIVSLRVHAQVLYAISFVLKQKKDFISVFSQFFFFGMLPVRTTFFSCSCFIELTNFLLSLNCFFIIIWARIQRSSTTIKLIFLSLISLFCCTSKSINYNHIMFVSVRLSF